jgi:SAM-dependent methyltransferase
MKPDAMTPHGLSLKAYFEGQTSAEVKVYRDDGMVNPITAKHFFRTPDKFTPIENTALYHCRGQVLDIGAGSGIHSLFLQSKGLPVTAIDISSEAVSIMKEHGVLVAVQADIFSYKGGPFNTLLMLGHGIGIAGDIEGLDKFLVYAHNLIHSNGQILLDSMDVSKTTDAQNIAYHEANRKSGRYIGETRFRMEFQGIKGPVCKWLHIDPKTLARHATKAGWNCQILVEQENGEYLACLSLIKTEQN